MTWRKKPPDSPGLWWEAAPLTEFEWCVLALEITEDGWVRYLEERGEDDSAPPNWKQDSKGSRFQKIRQPEPPQQWPETERS